MTNAEKLYELLKNNFENVEETFFVSVNYLENDCDFLKCPDVNSCLDCKLKNFWKEEYKGLTNNN